MNVTGKGTPVVFLHGSMAVKEQWSGITRELADRHKVISTDLIGYGETPRPQDLQNYSLKDESLLLQVVLDAAIGTDEAYHLVGHSYGGVVALYHAYHHRARIISLTTIEPMAFHLLDRNHSLLRESQMMVEEIVRHIEDGNPIAGAEMFIDLWMPPGTFARLSDREKLVLGEGVKKMVADFRGAANEPLSLDDYAALPMPHCLIAGKASPPYSLGITEAILKAIPTIEQHWVDGGHFSPVSHPHQVNPLIADFIKRAEDRRMPAAASREMQSTSQRLS